MYHMFVNPIQLYNKHFLPIWQTARHPLCGSCWGGRAECALSVSLQDLSQRSTFPAVSAPSGETERTRCKYYLTERSNINKNKTNQTYLSFLIVIEFALQCQIEYVTLTDQMAQYIFKHCLKWLINSDNRPSRQSLHHQHNPPPASLHHAPTQAADTGMEGNTPDPSLNPIKQTSCTEWSCTITWGCVLIFNQILCIICIMHNLYISVCI